MSDWWTLSCNANLLALGLSRKTPPPVSTFDTIDHKFKTFEKTYLELLELLRRDDKTIDVLDALTHPPLRQTLDEYNDFKYDSDALRCGAGSFSKRQLELPSRSSLPYKVARYVYTDADILQLDKKIDWQIRIMQAKMDDMVLSYFIHVHRRSEVRTGGNDHGSGLLARTLQAPRTRQTTNELHPRQDDDDTNILHLWERVDRLSNRLTRTSPHVQFRIDSNDAPPRLSPAEITRVIEPLKARFQKTAHKTASSIDFIQSADEAQLAKYSEERLKRLLASFPIFTTRKRVYFKDESGDSSRPPSNVLQNHAFDSGKVATLKIQPTKYFFKLMTVDIVSRNRQNFIVSTDESRTTGVLHYLPNHPVIHPSTNHRQVDSSTHDTEVSIEEECFVQITGSVSHRVSKALPLYNFPLRPDMLAFQCALRGKLIRHTFDVDSIRSERGLETSHQHLKTWSDFSDRNYTLSFYVKNGDAPGTHLELPVEWFEPKPVQRQDHPEFVRIYFRLPPKVSKLKRASRGSAPSVPSPGVMKNLQQRFPFSKPQHNSSEASSPPSSSKRKFSWNSRTSENSLSQSPPAGRLNQRSTSCSGSIDSQLTTDTTIDSIGYVSPAADPIVHPDANEMRYLNFEFTRKTDAELFEVEFLSVARKKMNSVDFGSGSIFGESRHPVSALTSESIVDDDIIGSPRALTLTEAEGRLPPVPVLQELVRPAVNEPAANEANSETSHDGSTIEEESIITGHTSIASQPRTPLTKEQHFKESGIVPDLVYRVQGIPINYQIGHIKKLLGSKFELDPFTDIDIRSLATSQDQRAQTAVVTFSNVPSVVLFKGNEWSFKWHLENNKASYIKIDTHFIGLTMLYTPDSAKHELDVCTVSGLGGHAFDSFKEKGEGGSYMWVLDLLQENLLGARIMIYGCYTKLCGNTQNRGLKTLARGLIDSVYDLGEYSEHQPSNEADDGLGNVPLIFIGHSLGGLVVKQAMIDAENHQEYKNFFESVYGALFFGVPSISMETAALETMMKDQANVPLVMNCGKDVQALTDQFNCVIKRQGLHIEYFFETEKSPRLGKDPNDNQWKTVGETIFVVTPESATNMLSFEEYSQYLHPIERNHSELVNWKAHDQECKTVLQVLKTMKERALAKQSDPHKIRPLVGEPRFPPPPRRQGTGFAPPSRSGTSFRPPSRQETGFVPPIMMRSGTAMTSFSPSTDDYQVGWICAVETEYVVALELLVEKFRTPSDLPDRDENAYSFGTIGDHYVVITCLAKGKYGLTSAASAANDMRRSFKAIRIGLMVGIGGGAPSKKHDIRLGDVVVSTPEQQKGGVIHYEFGKVLQNKDFEGIGMLNAPPPGLLSALQMLSALHQCHGHSIKSTVDNMVQKNSRLQKKYRKPDPQTDVLYQPSFTHLNDDQSCTELCVQHTDQTMQRPDRDPSEDDPVVHYGLIASADRLMKDAHVRDHLAETKGVLCFEMEAAGLMDRFPCVVIRGICDYSDTHKNDLWQGYAAATAAAYAKELLGVIPANKSPQETATAAYTMGQSYQDDPVS